MQKGKLEDLKKYIFYKAQKLIEKKLNKFI